MTVDLALIDTQFIFTVGPGADDAVHWDSSLPNVVAHFTMNADEPARR